MKTLNNTNNFINENDKIEPSRGAGEKASDCKRHSLWIQYTLEKLNILYIY